MSSVRVLHIDDQPDIRAVVAISHARKRARFAAVRQDRFAAASTVNP